MKTGSMVGVRYVNLVTMAVTKPQKMPMLVPPIATTAKDVQPIRTSEYSMFSGPNDKNELNML